MPVERIDPQSSQNNWNVYPNSGCTPIQATALQKITPTNNPAGSRHAGAVLLCILRIHKRMQLHNAIKALRVGDE
ncbi:MAG TPA: hypothetical protein VHY79_09270 [Rhizomicrobium sp.]|jgi:hypothetical protein|nr:hypothetical protein [Rhizomicrobium sp.]